MKKLDQEELKQIEKKIGEIISTDLPKNITEFEQKVIITQKSTLEELQGFKIEYLKDLFVREFKTSVFLYITKCISDQPHNEIWKTWSCSFFKMIIDLPEFDFQVEFLTDEEKILIKEALLKVGAEEMIENFN